MATSWSRRHSRSGLRLLTALGATAVALTLAAPALAYPQGSFACYATSLHVDGASDPLVANTNAVPCMNDSQSAASNQVHGSAGTAQSGANSASTSQVLHDTPVNGDNGSAQSSAQEAVIVSGNTVIKADVFNTQASVTCSAGSPQLAGSARVGALNVNGNPVPLKGGPQDVSTPAGVLHVDASYSPGSNVLYQRGLWLQTSAGDIIVSEAAVGYVNSPCVNGLPPPPPTPPNPAFGCRGIALQNNGNVSFVANLAVVPCVSSSSSAASYSAGNTFTSETGLYASTSSSPDPLPAYTTLTPYPQGTTVNASAGAATVDIGPGTGAEITAGVTSANATGACFNRAVVLKSSSQVHGLHVGSIAFADLTLPTDIPLPGGGILHVNWYFSDGYFVQRRALWLQTPAAGDVIVGDVIAGANDQNPC